MHAGNLKASKDCASLSQNMTVPPANINERVLSHEKSKRDIISKGVFFSRQVFLYEKTLLLVLLLCCTRPMKSDI